MKVVQIMRSPPVAIAADATLSEAMSRMETERIRHLPVVDRGRLIGVVSQRDLLEATGWEDERAMDAADRRPRGVRDALSLPAETVAPDDEVTAAAGTLVERRIGCLPVVSGAKLAGIVSEEDVALAWIDLARRGKAEDPEVGTCMSRDVATVDTGVTVGGALAFCRREAIRHLPVVEDGWLVGLVSDRDLLRWVGRGRGGDVRVDEVMTVDVITIEPDARLSQAALRMIEHGIGALPVTGDGRMGRLVGMVSIRDVVAMAAREPATAS